MRHLQPKTGPAFPARLCVVDRLIADLKPNPSNPRRHDRKQIRRLAAAIEAFGFNVPVLVNANDEIIAGHGRVLAAQHLGLSQVPTIRLEHLTEAKARAFIIADNRLAEFGKWDEQLLAEQLKILDTLELDFDIATTGFDIAEIDLRLSVADNEQKDDPADQLPIATETAPVTRLADVWQLGPHRIMCASCLDARQYACLMGDERAAMTFSDPPYNVPIDGHVSGLGAHGHREFAMASGEMSPAAFIQFLAKYFDLQTRCSIDGSIHFVCIDWRHVREVLAASSGIYSDLKNICVWVKHNAGMGSLYRSQHEFICVFKQGRGHHQNNVQLGQHGRHRTNVWNYPAANNFGRATDEGKLHALHPTVKPVALVVDAILDCSARGDLVFDGFLGSGTTLIAAERTGRRCCGFEIDPLYADVIVRRWQVFTGNDARNLSTGLTFNETAAAGAFA